MISPLVFGWSVEEGIKSMHLERCCRGGIGPSGHDPAP
jgi:hypothetical protein